MYEDGKSKFCKDFMFTNKYKTIPAVFVTPESSTEAQTSGNDNLFAWVKEIKLTYVRYAHF